MKKEHSIKTALLALLMAVITICTTACMSNTSKNAVEQTSTPIITSKPTATAIAKSTVTVMPTSEPTAKPTVVSKSTATAKPTTKPTSKPSTSSTFTNKYGTSTTICAFAGCTNYIASSGDTNCCTKHSRRCAECGCYIDSDATYCTSCLRKAAEKAATSSGRKCDDCSKTATKTLFVQQPSGEQACFYLCSDHYNEYKALFNSKSGWKAW